jgi:histone H3/H4
MAGEQASAWRRCSSCKREIAFQATYWVCSVSTCNRKRTGLVFCTTSCWDVHLPLMNHREAWAEERRAPTRDAWQRELAAESQAAAPARSEPAREPVRRIAATPAPVTRVAEAPAEILVVVSKLKAYVRERWGMNTSDAVAEVLSDRVRELCDRAIRSAQREGRKTLMDRDF